MYLITNSANLIVEICEHPCYVRRQANGVVVLSEQDKADAIYSNDSNTFWPTQQVGYLCDRHTLVEVESVPAEVVAGFYFYHAGEFYTTEKNLAALNSLNDTDSLQLDHEYRLTLLEIIPE